MTDMNRSAVSAAGEVGREVILHVALLAAAVGRVHQDDIKLIVHRVVEHITEQGILMEHARHIQPMQQQSW